jgi:hypothetical protein
MLNGCLYLPRETPCIDVLQTLGVYLLSALLYRWADYAAGVQGSESGAVRFFITHAVAVIVEKAVTNHVHIYNTRLARMAGYVWTIFFFIWTVPSWLFPLARSA